MITEETPGVDIVKRLVVDDKSIPGDSLGRRRAIIADKGIALFKIHKSYFFLQDLVKASNRRTYFIDNNGVVFLYIKEKFHKLTFHPIEAVYSLPAGGGIIKVKGMPNRFKTLFLPPIEHKYAGILNIGGFASNLLYGTYPTLPKKSTIRKI